MPYNVRTDFAPISLVSNAYLLLVMHPSVPVRTVKDVIALAKANPGKLNFGSAGRGHHTAFVGRNVSSTLRACR